MPSPNDLTRADLPPFAHHLLQSGYITVAQLQQALAEKRKSDRPLIEILPLVTGRPLPAEFLRRHRAEQLARLKATYRVDCLDPETEALNWPAIEHLFKTLLPFEICRRYQILPLRKEESAPVVLHLAMVDPANPEILDDLRRILRDKNLQFERKAIALADYRQAIESYRSREEENSVPDRSPSEKDLETLVDVTDVFEDEGPRPSLRDGAGENLGLLYQANQGPIVTLVNNLLVRAIESKASEVHLEPEGNEVTIRFRQDGIWRTGFEPIAREAAPAVLSRLKLLANLEIGHSPRPQQGKIAKTFSGRKIDFHLHASPSQQGEKILLRVFDSRTALWTLDELIVIEETRALVASLLDRPSGLILLSSPAGGGNSTSFYSLLAGRNRGDHSIATLETPIERVLNGVTQVESAGQDRASIVQSFRARGVKIIGIDRLDDRALATATVEAAAGGHLVIATLATHSAVGAMQKLVQLTDARSASSASIGVIHQRLARRVCPVCRLKHDPSPAELSEFGLSSDSRFYKANSLTEEESDRAREKGRLCRHCNGAGYQGQIALFEVMALSPRLKTAIASGTSARDLETAARAEGFRSLADYGLALVSRGHTTLDELQRVTGDRLPLDPPTPTSISPTVMKRIEELERLIGALGSELQALKREIASPVPTPAIAPVEIEEPRPRQDREMDKETIVSDPSIYEELTDPGDWERLKQELDPAKDTIVTVDPLGDDPSAWNINSTFRSVPDPWK